MKILFTTSSLTLQSGGPTQTVYQTVKGLHTEGIDAEILTYKPRDGETIISDEAFINTVSGGKNSFAWSPQFTDFMKNHEFDIYHAQGVWHYPTYFAAKTARRHNKPYIITLHGSLYPQDLKHHYFRKYLFYHLLLKNDLNRASAVHATCTEEMQHLRNLGVKAPIAVIPYPVPITNYELRITNYELRITNENIRVGYLGRVHPRKNIERLLYVWDKLNLKATDYELIIIGDGDSAYMDFLKSEKERLQLQNVVFTGFLTGEAKETAINSLSYLIVPSDFENFGMIIPEALLHCIPVIASRGTPWQELETHRCGWWVENDADTLAETLKKALKTPENERIEMGRRGRELIIRNYSVETVIEKMIRLYDWVLNGGVKPEFVYE